MKFVPNILNQYDWELELKKNLYRNKSKFSIIPTSSNFPEEPLHFLSRTTSTTAISTSNSTDSSSGSNSNANEVHLEPELDHNSLSEHSSNINNIVIKNRKIKKNEIKRFKSILLCEDSKTKLKLINNNISNEKFSYLFNSLINFSSSSPSLYPSLNLISLTINFHQFTSSSIKIFSSFLYNNKNLQILNLSSNFLTDDQFNDIFSSCLITTNIEKLILRNNLLTSSIFNLINSYFHELEIKHSIKEQENKPEVDIHDDIDNLSQPSNSSASTSLSTSSLSSSLFTSSFSSHLKHIDLNSNYLGKNYDINPLLELIVSNYPSLNSLNLGFNLLNSFEIKKILDALHSNDYISSINFDGNNFTDELVMESLSYFFIDNFYDKGSNDSLAPVTNSSSTSLFDSSSSSLSNHDLLLPRFSPPYSHKKMLPREKQLVQNLSISPLSSSTNHSTFGKKKLSLKNISLKNCYLSNSSLIILINLLKKFSYASCIHLYLENNAKITDDFCMKLSNKYCTQFHSINIDILKKYLNNP